MHKLSTVIIVRWLPGAWQGTGGGAYCKSVGGHKKSRAPLGSGGKSVVMVSIAYVCDKNPTGRVKNLEHFRRAR